MTNAETPTPSIYDVHPDRGSIRDSARHALQQTNVKVTETAQRATAHCRAGARPRDQGQHGHRAGAGPDSPLSGEYLHQRRCAAVGRAGRALGAWPMTGLDRRVIHGRPVGPPVVRVGLPGRRRGRSRRSADARKPGTALVGAGARRHRPGQRRPGTGRRSRCCRGRARSARVEPGAAGRLRRHLHRWQCDESTRCGWIAGIPTPSAGSWWPAGSASKRWLQP